MIYILIPVLILLAAYPLRNWLEIRNFRKLDEKWTNRLNSLPSKAQYCLEHQQDAMVLCNYCQFDRQRPHQLAVVPNEPQFGFISNEIVGESDFTVYSCARCGTELYGEIITKSK
jgi:DNA-directed RNA polymerase subunit RPC12/RpoP